MCLTAPTTIPTSINEVFDNVDIRSMIFNIKADTLVKERELEEWYDDDTDCYCEECVYCDAFKKGGDGRDVFTFINPETEDYGGPGDGIGICKKCDATDNWKKVWYDDDGNYCE